MPKDKPKFKKGDVVCITTKDKSVTIHSTFIGEFALIIEVIEKEAGSYAYRLTFNKHFEPWIDEFGTEHISGYIFTTDSEDTLRKATEKESDKFHLERFANA